MTELLSISDLRIGRADTGPDDLIVKGVDVRLGRGEIIGIVGETGAGKTLTLRALLGALPEGLTAVAERAVFDGETLGDVERTMRSLRGDRIGVVVQDPAAALPPIRAVGRSLVTILRTHRRVSRAQARERVLHLFREVGLADPEAVYRMRPHELSGGMAQRVVIAASLLTDPDVIIADEPTTALDPTVQLQILRLLAREVETRNAGAILITHDMGVVAEICTHVLVLYAGEVKEAGRVQDVLRNPQDPYTIALLSSLPDPHEAASAPKLLAGDGAPVVAARNVVKTFPGRATPVLDDVSIEVAAGRTLAIVGESGAGKTTLVRTILKLEPVDSGEILLDGVDVTDWSPRRFRPQRRNLQVVYQNPSAALNPRVTVEKLLLEPLLTFPETAPSAEERSARVEELMRAVNLDPAMIARYPGELSGGQKQRVAIARALATRPRAVVLDEPTASLDVSVRRTVLDLLSEIQDRTGVSYLLISHDFDTVRHLAHDVCVLYRGSVVEAGPAASVLGSPQNAYTQRLMEAELSADTSPAATSAEVA